MKNDKKRDGDSSSWSEVMEPPKTPPMKPREVDERFPPNGAMVPPDPEVPVEDMPPVPPMPIWRTWDLDQYEVEATSSTAGKSGDWVWIPAQERQGRQGLHGKAERTRD